MQGLQNGLRAAMPDLLRTMGDITGMVNIGGSSAFGINPSRGGGNLTAPSVGNRTTTVASGAIQIITPVRDPAIVANMVLDRLVAKAP